MTDPYDFMAFICLNLRHHLKVPSDNLISDFHRELCSFTQYERVALCAPRGFAKSSYLSFFYPLYLLLEKPGTRVMIVGSSYSLSEYWASQIRRELEYNKKLISRYGEMSNAKQLKWTNEYFELPNGSALQSRGYGQVIRGFRPNVILADDLETDEMVVSEDQRNKFDAWFSSSLTNTLMPGMQMVIIGTLLHPESALANIINKGRGDWKTKHYAAIQDGDPLWPEVWSMDSLMKRKAEIGEYAFEQEYQNNPLPDEHRKFQKQWFKYYEELPKRVNYFMSIDPAIKTHDKADYTAMVIVATDQFDNWYVVKTIRKKLLPKETVSLLFDMYERYNLQAIGIEDIAFQEMLIYEVKDQRRDRNLYPIIKTIKNAGIRKELRIESLQPRFESGKIFFKKDMEDLELELLRFPSPRCHDDLIDALSAISKIARPASMTRDKEDPNTFGAILARRRNSIEGGGFYGGDNLD